MADKLQYQARAEPVLTEALRPEVILPDKWMRPLSEPPAYKIARAVAFATVLFVSGGVVDPVALTLPETVSYDKFKPTFPDYVWPRRGLHVSLQQTSVVDPVQLTQLETVTVDKWLQPLSEPVLPRLRVAHTHFTLDMEALQPVPEEVPPINLQTTVAFQSYRLYQRETGVPYYEVFETSDKWKPTYPDQLLPAPRLATALQQFSANDAEALTQPEVVSIDRWLPTYPNILLPRPPSPVTNVLWHPQPPIVPGPNEWMRRWIEPPHFLIKPRLIEALQQAYAMDADYCPPWVPETPLGGTWTSETALAGAWTPESSVSANWTKEKKPC